MRVYGYVRASTAAQAEEGLSLEAQEMQLHGYAMMHDMRIDEIFTEKGVSGWTPLTNRPGGRSLLDRLEKGDVVICAKLDRMFRSAKEALDIADLMKRKGVSLHLLDLGGDVTGNGVSKPFFTIVAAFAEFERDRIAERISDVKENERRKGRFLGGSRPFGFTVKDGSLTPLAAEQSVIARIRKLRSEGMSLRNIAHAVSTLAHPVSHVTVKRILEDQQ